MAAIASSVGAWFGSGYIDAPVFSWSEWPVVVLTLGLHPPHAVSVRTVLSPLEHEVVEASNVSEALEVLQARDVGLVVAPACLGEPSEPIEQEFANDIVQAYAERQEEIDGLIRSSSHHWRLERMPIVDRNVLRVAIAELQTMTDIPKRVTLNEAVELAKRFGSEGSGSFVNGVLDKLFGAMREDGRIVKTGRGLIE